MIYYIKGQFSQTWPKTHKMLGTGRIFRQKEESLQHFLDKIKLQSYWGLKANKINFVFNYHLWWFNPSLPYLKITLY